MVPAEPASLPSTPLRTVTAPSTPKTTPRRSQQVIPEGSFVIENDDPGRPLLPCIPRRD